MPAENEKKSAAEANDKKKADKDDEGNQGPTKGLDQEDIKLLKSYVS